MSYLLMSSLIFLTELFRRTHFDSQKCVRYDIQHSGFSYQQLSIVRLWHPCDISVLQLELVSLVLLMQQALQRLNHSW